MPTTYLQMTKVLGQTRLKASSICLASLLPPLTVIYMETEDQVFTCPQNVCYLFKTSRKHLEKNMDGITKHREMVFERVTKRGGKIKAVFLKFLIPVCA